MIGLLLKKDTISIKDIAYLSAATHHEFALLRGKATNRNVGSEKANKVIVKSIKSV